MGRKTIIAFLLAFCLPALSHAQQDTPVRTIRIDPAFVEGVRPLSDIGVQKTILDTVSLRDNVTASLADVLSQNSTIFIKSYGRATLSTASFRGTAPSHTQVTWNGMKLNSPMLGMVDFSLIPSYFIDDAQLYHGASSVGVTGGGLGGAITLDTQPVRDKGLGIRFIQGVGSYRTFDDFLRVTYAGERWQSSTRVYYAASKNDFKYRNIRKWDFIFDGDHNIIGRKRPIERNKNGQFNDLHLLQELYCQSRNGDRWGVSAWYMDSKRGVPMLDVSYRDEDQDINEQHERTLRTTLSWERHTRKRKLSAKAGYVHTDLRYDYRSALGNDQVADNVRSISRVHTAYGRFEAERYLGEKWIFSGNLSLHQHFVNTQDKAKIPTGNDKIVGYDKARIEVAGFVSARYKPTRRLGLAVNLREDFVGEDFTPLIPAAFAEYLLSERGTVVLKASVARNHRTPTLNDRYFMPGGNDSLRPEKGHTCDGGVEFRLKNNRFDFKGEVAVYDSRIRDWIIWLPTAKGFWTPRNIKQVHSYGVEVKGRLDADLGRDWHVILLSNYAVTRSINQGEPVNWADESIGKQLVYIPEHSAGVTGKLRWKAWQFTYKWNYYSERYATSSNLMASKVWSISPYYMNDIALERTIRTRWGGLSLKATVNNLFDEEYVSVLSRPMAGRNYGVFLEITPQWNKQK